MRREAPKFAGGESSQDVAQFVGHLGGQRRVGGTAGRVLQVRVGQVEQVGGRDDAAGGATLGGLAASQFAGVAIGER